MVARRSFLVLTLIRIIAWLSGLGAAAWLFWRDILAAQGRPGLTINGNALWGRDFANVHSAGQLVMGGRLDILYDPRAYQAWQAAHYGPGILNHNYSYPPLTLFYTPLFGALPYLVALALWTLLSVALFAWAARPWMAGRGWLAILLPSTLVCIWAGHYGLILGALLLAAWDNVERRPRLAGVFTGLMIVKPHMAVLMPLMLLRRRAWTTIAWAALTVGIFVLAAILVFGPELWHTYLTQTSAEQLRMVRATKAFFIKMMPTITPALNNLGFAKDWIAPVQIGAAALVGIALWIFHPADPKRAALATAVGTFLVLPYAFNYDMTVVGLAAFVLLNRREAADHPWQSMIAALALALPATLLFFNRQGIWASPLILAALLAVLLSASRSTSSGKAA